MLHSFLLARKHLCLKFPKRRMVKINKPSKLANFCSVTSKFIIFEILQNRMVFPIHYFPDFGLKKCNVFLVFSMTGCASNEFIKW